MNPETKAKYRDSVEKQLDRARQYLDQRATQESADWRNPGDEVDRLTAVSCYGPLSPSLIPAALENTLAILESCPDTPLNKIEHGSEFTMLQFGTPDDPITQTIKGLFVDAVRCPRLSEINRSKYFLAPIPGGPNFLSSKSAAGKNIRGKEVGSEVSYLDPDGNMRIVRITDIDSKTE